jgi:hypothetical protein
MTRLLPPGAGSNKERLRHLNGGDESNQMSPFAKFVNFSLIAASARYAVSDEDIQALHSEPQYCEGSPSEAMRTPIVAMTRLYKNA